MKSYRISRPDLYKELSVGSDFTGPKRVDRFNDQSFYKSELKRFRTQRIATTTRYGISYQTVSDYGSSDLNPRCYPFQKSPSVAIPNQVWLDLEERCQEKLYSNMRQNSNLIVDLAESASTVKMLLNAMNLKKLIKEFCELMFQQKRVRKKTGRGKKWVHNSSVSDFADYASSKWLEGRYGWIPLMSSLYDAADNLYREVLVSEVAFSARASSRFEHHFDIPDPNYPGMGGHEFVTQSCRREVGYVFRRSQNDPNYLMKWTSLNPALIAWELMTLSFVVDWFANIGSQLEAWENWTLFTRHFVRGYRTNTVSELYQGTYATGHYIEPSYWPNGEIIPGRSLGNIVTGFGNQTFKSKNRAVLISLPRPVGFQARVNLNAKRVVDAAALSQGFLRSLLK